MDGARASFEHLESLIARERLDAGYERCGRFLLACNPSQFRTLERQVRALGERAEGSGSCRATRQREEIGSDFYHGGVVIEAVGGLHPAKLHRGLCARRTRAPAPSCTATPRCSRIWSATAAAWPSRPRAAALRAGQVVIATNGYTGALLPDLQRRVVPGLELHHRDRGAAAGARGRSSARAAGCSSTATGCSAISGCRPTAGGCCSAAGCSLRRRRRAAQRARPAPPDDPGLARASRLPHHPRWKGYLGFTFDRLPHMGVREGVPFRHGLQRQRRRHGELSRPSDRAQDPRPHRTGPARSTACGSRPTRCTAAALVPAGARRSGTAGGTRSSLAAGLTAGLQGRAHSASFGLGVRRHSRWRACSPETRATP